MDVLYTRFIHNITCDGNSSCWLDIDEPDGYECRCDEMFEKDENDECVSSLKCAKHPCSDENSVCEEALTHSDGYICPCNEGFRGDGKNVCYDINECRERSHNCERRNGICTNKKGTFACSCDFGYAGDGYHCIDHDECEAGDHLCPVGASCLNNDGSYFCQCTATACGNYGTCKNIAGGNAECLCDEFYKYHNQTCEFDNKCLHDPCGIGSCQTVVIDGRVTYSCICPNGYEWTAGTCLDMNECSLGPCPDGEPCINTVGSYQCGFDVDDSS